MATFSDIAIYIECPNLWVSLKKNKTENKTKKQLTNSRNQRNLNM